MTKKLEEIGAAVHMNENEAILLIRKGKVGGKIILTNKNGKVNISYSILRLNEYISELENLPKPYLMGGTED